MVRSEAEFFDSVAEQWDSRDRPSAGPRLERVVREAGVLPGMTVLDVGTGTGVLIPYLLAALGGSGRIQAIDVSAGMLRVAARKGFPPSVSLEQAAIETWNGPDASFERVFCNGVYPHFADRAEAVRNLFRLLKPGGILAISHTIGREAVNQIHSSRGPVAGHSVPTAGQMTVDLTAAGFREIAVTDEPDFYLALGARPLLE